MKYLFVFIFAVMICTPGYGQNVESPVKRKTAVVRIDLFYDAKVGITPLIEALKPLEKEFKPQDYELKQIIKKRDAIVKELRVDSIEDGKLSRQDLEKQVNEKTDEFERLERELADKTKEARTLYLKRRGEVTKDLMKDIRRSIDKFASERFLDIIIGNDSLDPIFDGVYDVSLDFIQFYNSLHSKLSDNQK